MIDFADRFRPADQTEDLLNEPPLLDEVVLAQRDSALLALRDVVAAFDRLGRDFSTPPQQRALSEARAVLAEQWSQGIER